jgi:hypothetical protein
LILKSRIEIVEEKRFKQSMGRGSEFASKEFCMSPFSLIGLISRGGVSIKSITCFSQEINQINELRFLESYH